MGTPPFSRVGEKALRGGVLPRVRVMDHGNTAVQVRVDVKGHYVVARPSQLFQSSRQVLGTY